MTNTITLLQNDFLNFRSVYMYVAQNADNARMFRMSFDDKFHKVYATK